MPERLELPIVECNLDEMEERIDDILARAKQEIKAKLDPANNLIRDVKNQISQGTDCITTAQLQEWAIVIPVICEELVPHKEAFALTKNLWDIETKQLAATNLLELDMKKVRIETINRLAGTKSGKKKVIAHYMMNMLAGTQESLWLLGTAVRKILDARIAAGNCR